MITQTEAIATKPGAGSPPIPAIVWVLVALFGLGLGTLVFGLNTENTQPDFRLFTVSYLVLLGVSQAGVVFCAITRLAGAQWSRPYYRLAELSTLAFLPLAVLGFLLIFFFGQDELFYWLAPNADEHLSSWLNIDWLLFRNLFGLLLFYGLSVAFVRTSRGKSAASPDAIRERLYKMSPWIILAYILCSTFFAWDFAMMLIPHWHSTVFPIFFWFGNGVAGIAAMIAFPALLGYSKDGHSTDGQLAFGPDQIRCMGMLITAFTLLWLYLFWAQFFVVWFGNLPQEMEPVWRQMYGHYAPYFWTMMAGCFFVPFVTLLFAAVKRSLVAMCLIAVGINVGNWLCKYLLVIPALSPDSRPFEHWVDLVIAVGLLAGFLATLLLLARRLPETARR